MKKVIVDFAPECEQYSEIRLTFVTDGFKNRENQDYTYLTIAAKHTETDNVSMVTAMNPYSFYEQLWKFGLGEEDLQTILDAFSNNKYIKEDLEHFAWCGDLQTEEFIQYFYRKIETQAWKKLAKKVWNYILCNDKQDEEEVTINNLPVSKWHYGLFELKSNSEYCALELDTEFDDWAVSQYFEDYGFHIHKDEDGYCLVDVRMHNIEDV